MKSNTQNSQYKIYIAMIIATFFWSGAFIAGKFSVPYIPVCTLTFLRFLFASIILYFVMKISNNKLSDEGFKFQKEHIKIFAFTGIVGMVGYHLLFFTSLKYTTAINSSMIGGTNPIVTTVIAAIFLRNKVQFKQALGIAISFIGVVLTITGANLNALTTLSFNKGDIIMLIAVVCWASYAVFSKSKGKDIPALPLTYYSFVFCTIFLVPLVILEKPWTFWSTVPASAWIATLYMAIFPSVIGYLVQQYAIKEIGPTRASIFVNLVPVFSIILAVLILHEELIPIKILTALIIIAGVCICQIAGQKMEQPNL